jgi:hypothetical protein
MKKGHAVVEMLRGVTIGGRQAAGNGRYGCNKTDVTGRVCFGA